MIDNRYLEETKNLISFIEDSPSCYHVIDNIKKELTENGYIELYEGKKWDISGGKKYFVIRNYSSVIAFQVPENDFNGFMICSAHSDSPTFKIKPNAEIEMPNLYKKLNCEKYGGMIYSSWLDRPLSAAGRVLVQTEIGVETKLVNIDRDFCLIPNLAIHMQKDINNGYAYTLLKDIIPLMGSADSGDGLKKIIADTADVSEDKILDFDIFLYNRTHGSIWGIENEYFSTGKIDDLQCVYSAKEAFIQAENPDMINVLAIFDNEEVGSGTKQGAKSTFLSDMLTRITEAIGLSSAELARKIASSFMVSADNGHAVHPNHPEKSDALSQPKMNGGVIIKYNANQQYSTDAVSAAIFKKILKNADIPYQEFSNRSDIPSGSTLGNLSNQQVSVNTIDIGAAQLAMHSSYETGGVKDTTYLIDAMKAFYNAKISAEENGSYKITR